jgi:tRNA A37 threonylcarbamoyladenosine biosynthesis protein TsaE
VLSHIALRMGQEPGLPARLDMVKTGPVRDGRLARPQRIYIIGGGGSGKTTLGRQVARALGLGLTRGRAHRVHS